MGLFRKRKSRATRRAEARAIKARAKLEAKLAAKNDARRLKADRRAAEKALNAQIKSQRDSDRTALKVAETELKTAKEGKYKFFAEVHKSQMAFDEAWRHADSWRKVKVKPA